MVHPRKCSPTTGAQYVTWRGESRVSQRAEARRGILSRSWPGRGTRKPWGRSSASGARSGDNECLEAAVFTRPGRCPCCADRPLHRLVQLPAGSFRALTDWCRPIASSTPRPTWLAYSRSRVAANALELLRHGVPTPPFYLTGSASAARTSACMLRGERVFLTNQAGLAARDRSGATGVARARGRPGDPIRDAALPCARTSSPASHRPQSIPMSRAGPIRLAPLKRVGAG